MCRIRFFLLVLILGLPFTGAAQEPILPDETSPGASSLAKERVLPWDVYRACHGLSKLNAETLKKEEYRRVQRFCTLGLPRLGNRYAGRELGRWEDALDSLPRLSVVRELQDSGEVVLEERLQLLTRVRVAGGALSFAYGVDRLTNAERDTIRAAGGSIRAFLEQNPGESVEVVGYANLDRSGQEANEKEALKRAEAIAAVLLEAGISRDQIHTVGKVVPIPADRQVVPSTARGVDMLVSSTSQPSLRASSTAAARPGFSGPSASALLIGTTDFLMERAREQVEEYLLRTGTVRVCSESTGWRSLFPSTCALIPDDTAKAPGARYMPGLNVFRTAIREDLRTIPYRVGEEALVGALKDTNLSAAQQEQAALAVHLIRYLREVTRGTPPLQALAAGGTLPTLPAGAAPLPLLEHLRRLTELARQVRSAREDLSLYWQAEALGDSAGLYAIKSLALNTAAEAEASGWDRVRIQAGLNDLARTTRNMQSLAVSIDSGWVALRSVRGDSATQRAERVAIVARMLGQAAELGFGVLPATAFQAKLDTLNQLVPPARDLAVALAVQDAPTALHSLLRLSGMVLPADRPLHAGSVRAMTFATDLSEARESDDVKTALNRFVGTGPGYRGKREGGRSYWKVNAYAGVGFGWESLQEEDDLRVEGATAETGGAVLSPALPLGVEFGKATAGRWSLGAFVQILDLGAIASARLSDKDGLDDFPEFGFGSVIAPGIFGIVGWKDSPFALGVGVSYVPQARQIDQSGTDLSAIRLSVFPAIDIPLLP